MKHSLLNLKDYIEYESFPITLTRMPAKEVTNSREPHSHEFSEIVIIIAGSIRHLTKNGNELLHAGDFFLIHPGAYHAYIQPSPNAMVYNLMYDSSIPIPMLLLNNSSFIRQVYPDSRSEHFSAFSGQIHHIPWPEIPRLTEILEHLKKENEERKQGYQSITIALFITAVLLLSRHYPQKAPKELKWRLEKVFAFLKNHLHEHFTLQDLGKMAGMSQSTLYRNFKSEFGFGPMEYLQKLRVERAVTLLENSAQTSESIAFQCGFYDYTHMWKLFQKHLQRSPASIRTGKKSATPKKIRR